MRRGGDVSRRVVVGPVGVVEDVEAFGDNLRGEALADLEIAAKPEVETVIRAGHIVVARHGWKNVDSALTDYAAETVPQRSIGVGEGNARNREAGGIGAAGFRGEDPAQHPAFDDLRRHGRAFLAEGHVPDAVHREAVALVGGRHTGRVERTELLPAPPALK